jgi:NADH:ubiquinone oxidoreductase subunit 3 (subunit A)
MDVKFKIFLISTILNILDLLTSILDFRLGYVELNKWMTLFNNSYLSATMAVVLFEVILVLWYIIARKYENAKYGMIAFGLTKLYPIINNIYLLIISFLA